MKPPFPAILLLLLSHAGAWVAWARFTHVEATENARLITANGSADDLRAGFHQRRSWVRFWPWLGLVVVGNWPLALSSWLGYLLGCLALGIGLAAFFGRYFTPWLNVAMKLDYKPEFYASPDSASWPDAAVWRQARAEAPLMPADRLQGYANMRLAQLLTRTYRFGLIAYCLLLAGAGALVFL